MYWVRGENADWSNPAHTDGCDPDDTTGASNHRWTGTGGGDDTLHGGEVNIRQ